MNETGSRTGLFVGIVVLIIIIAGAVWAWNRPSANTETSANTNTTGTVDTSGTPAGTDASSTTSGTTDTPTAPMSATVTYTAQGFSPSTVTIAKGGTVTFVNQSGGGMWIASNPHPTHQGYDGTTRAQHCATGYSGPAPFDQCGDGNSFRFTFDKIGAWGYHNHEGAELGGTIIVQ